MALRTLFGTVDDLVRADLEHRHGKDWGEAWAAEVRDARDGEQRWLRLRCLVCEEWIGSPYTFTEWGR